MSRLSVLVKLFPFLISSTIFLTKYPRYVPVDVTYIILKCLPIVFLAFFVLQNSKSNNKPEYLKRIFFGLILSSIADAVICLKPFFLYAVGIFALVHIIYLSSFGFKPLRLDIAFILAIIEICCSCYLLPFVKSYPFKFILTTYVTFLFAMIWRSISKVRFDSQVVDWPNIFGALGSILFGVSDILLCYNMYAYQIEYGNLVIMITYYYAQAGIALSVLNSKLKD